MRPFDLFIIHISWENGEKSRPVLVYILGGNDIGVYQITTQYENKSNTIKAMYFEINDWEQAGLNKPSYVDTGTLIDIPEAVLISKKPIGKLTERDKLRLIEFLTRKEV